MEIKLHAKNRHITHIKALDSNTKINNWLSG